MLLLLIRHGATDETGKRLVGRTPGIHLNGRGLAQAEGLAERLAGVPVAAIYSSPLERAQETAAPLCRARGIQVSIDPMLTEMDYGTWTGRSFRQLRLTALWKRIQQRPGDARFPGGEAIRDGQARILQSIELIAGHHPRQVVAVFSHGDVIRTAVAHLLGLHIDLYQRLQVSPASVTAIVVGSGPPALLRFNDTGSLADLVPHRPRPTRRAGGR